MFSKVFLNDFKMAAETSSYAAAFGAETVNVSNPCISDATLQLEPKPIPSILSEKVPKKRGRKRKSEKLATPTEDANGPRPVKRGRGRPPRSAAQVTNATTTGQLPGGDAEPEGANAARERSRVKTLRDAFLELQRSLPSVPPDTKLSKLDVLVLATTYISHLMKTLDDGDSDVRNTTGSKRSEKQHRLKTNGLLHPVKKWPMRSRLYAGAGGVPVTPSTMDTVSPSSTSV